MKILHTADWHLGRTLGGFSLLEDQKHCVDQLLEATANQEIELLIVAGDVFDRAVPPVEALNIFNDFLNRVSELNVPTVIIPGNHDQAERLKYGSGFLKQKQIHLVCDLRDALNPIIVKDRNNEEFAIYACPFAEPGRARNAWDTDGIKSQEDIYRHLVEKVLDDGNDIPKILVAHAFVSGGSASDSERLLTVGGSELIPADYFQSFAYVALGHLHRPQNIGSEKIRYSGSPFPYSFSEEEHEKSFSLIELNQNEFQNTEIPFNHFRKLRTIHGKLDDLIRKASEDDESDDYIRVILEDRGLVLDSHQRLVRHYPRLVEITRESRIHQNRADDKREDIPATRQSLTDHFESFFKHVKGTELSDEQKNMAHSLWQESESEE